MDFVDALLKVYPNVLLQCEDLFKGNAIKQLNRHRDVVCSFNDDIQGTGSIQSCRLVRQMIDGAVLQTRK